MAGNKLNTKNKGKDDKSKLSKGVNQISEDVEEVDFALLRKPILTSITGFAQARKIFDLATIELKELLSNECDLLYECKVCRNIFRSLANFISHKRVYCKEKFNSSVHSHFIKISSTADEILKIKQTEEGFQESLKNKNSIEETDENDDRIPLSKDLTAIIEKMTQTKGISDKTETDQVVLQKIPTSTVAVFQNMECQDTKNSDNMRAEVKEIDNILSRDQAVLQSDGKFTIESSKEIDKATKDADNVIQISDDDEMDDGNILKCKICGLQFSTQKTLKFHMKYKHLESRLVYPCPDCLEIFSTSWSVYRHLFKVHRKTAAQIRRLRESIQAKAFRMNNPPAFYEKRKNNKPVAMQRITEEERLDQENQAWMDNMEGDGEVPRCGGCGRTFERRAALAAHTHTCQPRSRALARRPESKKIEIQIRKDYNKGPTGLTIQKIESTETKLPKDETQSTNKLQNDTEKREDEDKDLEEPPMDEEQKSDDSAEPPDNMENSQIDFKPAIMLPFAIQAEKSNLAAFKQRISSEIDYHQLLCKKCYGKYNTVYELYEHMADHFKWMRYACKLCNFKHYAFDNLIEHIKLVHKLKGDSEFYFSTMKAIDGTEAMIISRCLVEPETPDEANETNEISPDSRRPSRCSSDSSRLSDESSSSGVLKESSTRKRKIYHNKNNAKKRKGSIANDEGDDKNEDITSDKTLEDMGEKDTTANVKGFEENSLDMDDIEEKISKRHNVVNSSIMTSRRPIRKRTKPKNEDFEYDLSNLLKMEAQGYRDSQSLSSSKTTQSKKKPQQENISENINKDFYGALVTLSRKAVDSTKAHMKNDSFCIYGAQQKEQRSSSIFVRPMLPRIVSRNEKISPRKDVSDESSPNKTIKIIETQTKDTKTKKFSLGESEEIKTADKDTIKTNNNKVKIENPGANFNDNIASKNVTNSDKNMTETIKNKINNMPAVVPIKFRRQSLELMNNPIINKNITDFSKAGMKTKILVIKPINRNKDRPANVPLKFQTIKLKDTNNKSTLSEEKSSDQVVVVKVPKVDPKVTIPQAVTDVRILNTEKLAPSNNAVDNNEESNVDKGNEKTEKVNEIDKNNESDEMYKTCNGKETTPDNPSPEKLDEAKTNMK